MTLRDESNYKLGGLMDSTDDINNRFAFHPATEKTGPEHNEVRELCRALAHRIDDLIPVGREKSLAITHLEETMMWANAAIARQ